MSLAAIAAAGFVRKEEGGAVGYIAMKAACSDTSRGEDEELDKEVPLWK
jgi:hypothetical protein